MLSAALALQWIRLAEQAPVDMPQAVHWRFIPALNPDGLFNRPPRRVNANGVDLKRNFATPNWDRDATAYWEKRTDNDPRRYPGVKPLSEPGGVHKGIPVVTIELPDASRWMPRRAKCGWICCAG